MASDRAKTPALVFCFPYQTVSGVPVLFARLADHFAARGRRVRVVDYAEGAMANCLIQHPDVQLLEYDPDAGVDIGPDDVLIMQAMLPATIFPGLRVHPRTRFVFWALYPGNLLQTLIPIDRIRNWQLCDPRIHRLGIRLFGVGLDERLKWMIENMHAAGSLWVMDAANLRPLRAHLGADVPDPVFIPVPVDIPSTNEWLATRERDGASRHQLRVTWLGRLDDFKIHILNHCIKRFSGLALDLGRGIRFTVVGDGPLADRVVAPEHGAFNVERLGVLYGDDLSRCLIEQTDVLCAMGTSALEGARLGVPTILVDFSMQPLRAAYRFRWLDTVRHYNLGEPITDRHYERPEEPDSLLALVRGLERDPESCSERCQNHCRQGHSLDKVAAQVAEQAARARFTWGMLPASLQAKSVLRRAYDCVRLTSSRRNG